MKFFPTLFRSFLRCAWFHAGLVFGVVGQKSVTFERPRSLLVRSGRDCWITIVSDVDFYFLLGRPWTYLWIVEVAEMLQPALGTSGQHLEGTYHTAGGSSILLKNRTPKRRISSRTIRLLWAPVDDLHVVCALAPRPWEKSINSTQYWKRRHIESTIDTPDVRCPQLFSTSRSSSAGRREAQGAKALLESSTP